MKEQISQLVLGDNLNKMNWSTPLIGDAIKYSSLFHSINKAAKFNISQPFIFNCILLYLAQKTS